MKTLIIVLDVLTGLLVLSTIICGVWIKAQPQVDPSSIRFHLQIALVSTAFVVATIVLSNVAAFRARV